MHGERLLNIIYILADDLGYVDLSVLGQTHFETLIRSVGAGRDVVYATLCGCNWYVRSRCALMTESIRGIR